MSTREGQAASVTLLRREQLRKVVRPYIPKYRRGAKSQKRADEGIGPHMVHYKIEKRAGHSPARMFLLLLQLIEHFRDLCTGDLAGGVQLAL